jgi:hypothetical protein
MDAAALARDPALTEFSPKNDSEIRGEKRLQDCGLQWRDPQS